MKERNKTKEATAAQKTANEVGMIRGRVWNGEQRYEFRNGKIKW